MVEDTHGWWLSNDPGLALDAAGLPWRPSIPRLSRFLLMEDDDAREDFLEGVIRLRPGERWCTDGARGWIEPAPPWPASPDLHGARDAQALSVRLEAALRAQLERMSGPRVFTLSGGLDSSTLVALAEERPAQAVTIGFDSARDETRPSAELAAALGASQTRIAVDHALPLHHPSAHQRSPSLGPHAHPGEGYDDAFYARVSQHYPEHMLMMGTGADQLLSVPNAAIWRWLLRHGTPSQRRRMMRVRPGATAQLLIREGLRHAGLLQHVRARRARPTPAYAWTDPTRWVCHRAAPPEPPSDPRHGLLAGWSWEHAMRSHERQRRRGHLHIRRPFLSEEVWRLLWPLSLSALRTTRQDKTPLRLIAARHVPAALAWRGKISGFDAAITAAICQTHAATIPTLLSDGALAAHHLIEAPPLLDAFEQLIAHASTHTTRPVPLLAIWRAIAAELWWRAIDQADHAWLEVCSSPCYNYGLTCLNKHTTGSAP